MAKRRKKVDIHLKAIPKEYEGYTARCPVCERKSPAVGRLSLHIVFRCEKCQVLFKRLESSFAEG